MKLKLVKVLLKALPFVLRMARLRLVYIVSWPGIANQAQARIGRFRFTFLAQNEIAAEAEKNLF